jgi:hypothetical protein
MARERERGRESERGKKIFYCSMMIKFPFVPPSTSNLQ